MLDHLGYSSACDAVWQRSGINVNMRRLAQRASLGQQELWNRSPSIRHSPPRKQNGNHSPQAIKLFTEKSKQGEYRPYYVRFSDQESFCQNHLALNCSSSTNLTDTRLYVRPPPVFRFQGGSGILLLQIAAKQVPAFRAQLRAERRSSACCRTPAAYVKATDQAPHGKLSRRCGSFLWDDERVVVIPLPTVEPSLPHAPNMWQSLSMN